MITSFTKRSWLFTAPLVLLASLTSCNKADNPDPVMVSENAKMVESRTYDGEVLLTRTTFNYNAQNQITESVVHNYTAGVETGSYTVTYNYAADDGRLLSAVSPVNETHLGYDSQQRYNGCHTVWTDSAARPNFKANYIYSATNTDVVDSLIVAKTQPGQAPFYSHMKYSYAADGSQAGAVSNDVNSGATVRLSADGKRISGIAVKENGKESFMALVYSEELAGRAWMQPYITIQHVAGAQCPYISPNDKHTGKASHILDAYSVSDVNYVPPGSTYTQEPEGKLVRHTVKVGEKIYVYYTQN